jgi:hypothetical protein
MKMLASFLVALSNQQHGSVQLLDLSPCHLAKGVTDGGGRDHRGLCWLAHGATRRPHVHPPRNCRDWIRDYDCDAVAYEMTVSLAGSTNERRPSLMTGDGPR